MSEIDLLYERITALNNELGELCKKNIQLCAALDLKESLIIKLTRRAENLKALLDKRSLEARS